MVPHWSSTQLRLGTIIVQRSEAIGPELSRCMLRFLQRQDSSVTSVKLHSVIVSSLAIVNVNPSTDAVLGLVYHASLLGLDRVFAWATRQREVSEHHANANAIVHLIIQNL